MRNIYSIGDGILLQLPLLITAIGIYVFNKLILISLLKDSLVSGFITSYLNDLIAPIALFSLVNVSFALSKRCLITVVPLLFICVIASVTWELDPFSIRPGSVADWLDVDCYFIGTLCYWMILRWLYNVKRPSKKCNEVNQCQ